MPQMLSEDAFMEPTAAQAETAQMNATKTLQGGISNNPNFLGTVGSGFSKGLQRGATAQGYDPYVSPQEQIPAAIGDVLGTIGVNAAPHLAGPWAGIPVNIGYAGARNVNQQLAAGKGTQDGPPINYQQAGVQAALGGITGAVPGAMGGSTLTRTATGAALGAASGAAPVLTDQAYSPEGLNLTDPNLLMSTGLGAVTGGAIGGATSPSVANMLWQRFLQSRGQTPEMPPLYPTPDPTGFSQTGHNEGTFPVHPAGQSPLATPATPPIQASATTTGRTPTSPGTPPIAPEATSRATTAGRRPMSPAGTPVTMQDLQGGFDGQHTIQSGVQATPDMLDTSSGVQDPDLLNQYAAWVQQNEDLRNNQYNPMEFDPEVEAIQAQHAAQQAQQTGTVPETTPIDGRQELISVFDRRGAELRQEEQELGDILSNAGDDPNITDAQYAAMERRYEQNLQRQAANSAAKMHSLSREGNLQPPGVEPVIDVGGGQSIEPPPKLQRPAR